MALSDHLARVELALSSSLDDRALSRLSHQLCLEYKQGLATSDASMLPSHWSRLPTGHETGNFLALDVGGTNFRLAFVKLNGQQNFKTPVSILAAASFTIDDKIRALSGLEFFAWMAGCIHTFLHANTPVRSTMSSSSKPLRMGLSWSFPVNQTSASTARILSMGKGFRASIDLHRFDLNALLMTACHRYSLNVRLSAIVVDAAATLLSQAYLEPTEDIAISLILGTGVNAAAYMPIDAFGSPKQPRMLGTEVNTICNTELSMFGHSTLPSTEWDDKLRRAHPQPDYQPLEQRTSGRYLGEIVRLILVDAVKIAGLAADQNSGVPDTPYSLTTDTMAAFESDTTPDLVRAELVLLAAHPQWQSSPTERSYIKQVSALVSTRAAALVASALHALCTLSRNLSDTVSERSDSQTMPMPMPMTTTTVATDGSVLNLYPGFQSRVQEYLDRLAAFQGEETGLAQRMTAIRLRSPGSNARIESSLLGAAVAAAIATHQT